MNAPAPTTIEIEGWSRSVTQRLVDSEGEASDEILAELEQLDQAEEEKAAVLAAVLRRLTLEAVLLDEQADKLQQAAKAVKRQEERVESLLQRLLLGRMERTGSGSVPRVAHLRKSTRLVSPEDVSAWPEAWTRTKVEPSASTAKAAILSGCPAPAGFELSTSYSVIVR